MKIIRAYPQPDAQKSAPARLISALRRLLVGRPPPVAHLAPDEPYLDLHVAPLAGEARLLIAGQPPGAWRNAVLQAQARSVSGSLSEAVDQAVVTLYSHAPSALEPTFHPPQSTPLPSKPLPRGARPGGPRFGTARLVPVPRDETPPRGRIQVATYAPRPEEWIETPMGMWAPQSGVYRPKRPTKTLYTLDDVLRASRGESLRETEPISVRDYATILARMNHRALDREYQ